MPGTHDGPMMDHGPRTAPGRFGTKGVFPGTSWNGRGRRRRVPPARAVGRWKQAPWLWQKPYQTPPALLLFGHYLLTQFPHVGNLLAHWVVLINYRDSTTCPSPQLRAVFCFPSRDETICNTASVTFVPMYGPTPVQRHAMFMSCFCNLLLGVWRGKNAWCD